MQEKNVIQSDCIKFLLDKAEYFVRGFASCCQLLVDRVQDSAVGAASQGAVRQVADGYRCRAREKECRAPCDR